MRVLTYESPDKHIQKIETIPYRNVLAALNEDHGWIEVIDAYDQNNLVRMFFDVDSYSGSDPLTQIMGVLNAMFKCAIDDWAISDGTRKGKFSYHILSKRFSITLKHLRKITSKLHSMHPSIDHTLLFISPLATNELLFFRLPNQSKNTLHKVGAPMHILQGELADFIVTHTSGLTTITPE